MNAAEPVYMELVDFVAHGSTVEQVANFRPSAESHILGLAKAKAQLILAGCS